MLGGQSEAVAPLDDDGFRARGTERAVEAPLKAMRQGAFEAGN